jgi:hypothetical protein
MQFLIAIGVRSGCAASGRSQFTLPFAIYARQAIRLRPTIPSMFSINRLFRVVFIFLATTAFVFLALGAPAAPPAGVLDETHAAVRAVMAAQGEVTPALIQQSEILGTAVGVDTSGASVLTVYIDRNAENAGEVIRNLPRQFRGVGVQVHLMEQIHAMGNTAAQTPPISLGTSGGWAFDLANRFCCGGTLGSLVSIGGTQYILSAGHVLEGDIVRGGNNRIARTGDPIIQPGLIDVGCKRFLGQTVGTLVKRRSLSTSNVDCGIAQVVPGMVGTDGAILDIGTISSDIASAALNQGVKKSGRTTGLTSSSISGLNATVKVAFTHECHGTTYFKTFTGQIVVQNPSMAFLKSGDSGSLLVEDQATNPRAIGLLFAGNNTAAFANPIGDVLNFLGATMVGQ